MNAKIEKKIRRYAQLRLSKAHPHIPMKHKIKTLKKIYERSSDKKRAKIVEEMDQYIAAVRSGEIESGDSIINMAWSLPDSGFASSKPAGDQVAGQSTS